MPEPGPRRSRRDRLLRFARDLAVSVGLALLVVAAIQWSQRQAQRGGGGVLPVGSEAPLFSLGDARSGATVDLLELRGQPVILSFWATWCGACVAELPDLARLEAAEGERFHLLTIADEPPSVVQPFLARRQLDLPVLYDAGGAVARRYRVRKIPMTVILDREGRVVHDFSGPADVEILGAHIEALLKDPPAPPGASRRAAADEASGGARPSSDARGAAAGG